MLSCHQDSTTGEHQFYDNLGDDPSEEISFWKDEESYGDSDYYSDKIDFKEEVLFISSDEEVIEDLFDEA